MRVVRRVNGAMSEIEQAQPVAPLEIGEVLVRGANVSPEYLGRPEATQRAKVRDGVSFWHRMGDVGYLDDAGRLFFCGRVAHVVETPTRTLYPIPVERVFNAHPDVKRSALIRYRSDDAAVVIEPQASRVPRTEEEQQRFTRELRELAARSTVASPVTHIFFCESFPVDGRHNAKIFRDKLGDWVAAHEGQSPRRSPSSDVPLWQRLIPHRG